MKILILIITQRVEISINNLDNENTHIKNNYEDNNSEQNFFVNSQENDDNSKLDTDIYDNNRLENEGIHIKEKIIITKNEKKNNEINLGNNNFIVTTNLMNENIGKDEKNQLNEDNNSKDKNNEIIEIKKDEDGDKKDSQEKERVEEEKINQEQLEKEIENLRKKLSEDDKKKEKKKKKKKKD